MNEGGNHGGSDTGETETALVFASPKFRTMRIKNPHECPTLPSDGTTFDYYRKVEQQDLVPTLSALLGLPIPRNSIGRILSELQGIWPDEKSYIHVLARNAQQLWNVAHSVFGTSTAHEEELSCSRNVSQRRTTSFNQCTDGDNTVGRLAYLLASAEQQAVRSSNTRRWTNTTSAYEEFLTQAQRAIIEAKRSFDLKSMAAGITLC
jgi:ethanolaminephosphotransferase